MKIIDPQSNTDTQLHPPRSLLEICSPILGFIVFLFAVALLALFFDKPNQETIESDAKTYKVTYSADLVYNNSVGEEWSTLCKFKGTPVENNGTVKAANDSFYMTVSATEYDDGKSDHGSTRITFSNINIGEEQTKNVYVIVTEDSGRYIGNKAKWKFTITVKRIS